MGLFKNSLVLVTTQIILSVAAWAGEPPSFVLEWGTEGSQPGEFFLPRDVAVDANGNVYVLDAGNHRIQKFDNGGGFIQQWETDYLYKLVVHRSHLYATTSRKIVKYDLEGGLIATTDKTAMVNLDGIAAYEEEIWAVTDYFDGMSVYVFTEDLDFVSRQSVAYGYTSIAINSTGIRCLGYYSRWSCSDGKEGPSAYIVDLTFDSVDNLHILGRYQMRSLVGGEDIVWGEQGEGPGQFQLALGIGADSIGNIFIADARNHRIQKFSFGPVPVKPLTWGRIKAKYEE